MDRHNKILNYLNNQNFDVVSHEMTKDSMIYTAKTDNHTLFLEDYIDELDFVICSSYVSGNKQPTITGSLDYVLELISK